MTGALRSGWPPELRRLRTYLPYQLRPRASGRLGKCPSRWAGRQLYPVNPHAAEHHLSFERALELLDAGCCDGIGLILDERVAVLNRLPLAAIDLDDVVSAGAIGAAAATLVGELASYAELSVSGHGLHVIVAGHVPPGARRGRAENLSVELITTGFLAVTGRRWPGTPTDVASRPGELARLQAALCAASPPPLHPGPPPGDHADLLSALLTQRNAPKVQRLLLDGDVSGYASASEAVYAAARLVAWRTRDPAVIEAVLRASPLFRPRWDRRATADGRSWIAHTIRRALDAGTGAT
ncbi:hypothetical protein [Deinococcus yunweiensis]|uniref:phage NrS-1 polymerase family protein n=1 Tax=Deinococcus yunweiensis TaxID=367282 RepID=UPI00398E3C7B